MPLTRFGPLISSLGIIRRGFLFENNVILDVENLSYGKGFNNYRISFKITKHSAASVFAVDPRNLAKPIIFSTLLGKG